MAEKETVMRLRFAADEMPAIPAQGYGVGTPASINQHGFAATAAGMDVTRGVFRPQKWGEMAQIAADFALTKGRVTDEGWNRASPASDITHHMYSNQGRYQASLPGTAAHNLVQSYKAAEAEEKREKQEKTIQHLDGFIDKLKTATTSLAYLTGASGGLSSALNRAGSVFAAFQGAQSLLGMGNTSIGGLLHGIGSTFTGGNMLGGVGLGALGVAGLGMAGISAAGSYGPATFVPGMSGTVANQGKTFGQEISQQFWGLGTGNESGRGRNILAQAQSDWNRGVVATIGGGRVDNQGRYISQQHDLNTVHGQLAHRLNTFQGSQSLESQRLGFMGQRHSLEQQYTGILAQYGGYEGYAQLIGAGDEMGGLSTNYTKTLGEQPASLVPLMNKIYGNTWQGQSELASHMIGIREQGRGFATNTADAQRRLGQVGLRRTTLNRQLQEAVANTSTVAEREVGGMNSGAAIASKQKEVSIQQELNALITEEAQLKKQMMDNDKAILETRRQQSIATQANLTRAIQSEEATHEQAKISYGRLDPGQRAYVKGVITRYDKGGRRAVAPDEMSIVEQYRRREAEKDYKEITDEEKFVFKGKMSEDVIKSSQDEIKKQAALTVELSRAIDVKLEMDNKQLTAQLKSELGPQFTKVTVQLAEIGRQLVQVAEGLNQLHANQKQ